jgi:aspartate racemase
MHPPIVMSAVPMALSMAGWERSDYAEVGRHLAKGVKQVADAGADFFVCPDNTAHIVLERIASELPIPGLHIAEVVCRELAAHGWKHAALLGTEWTMTGPVYPKALGARGFAYSIPDAPARARLHAAIFDELCRGVFRQETTRLFLDAIESLREKGADCVILGCTEIPLIVNGENSPLPVLDSTRLLARYGVLEALREEPLEAASGWLGVRGGRAA